MVLKRVMLKILMFIGLAAFICGLAAAYFVVREENTAGLATDSPVDVCIIGYEQDADCILISQGEQNILIDTGEASDREKTVAYIKDKGITTIDYLILTHPDQDHIGGAEAVLNEFAVRRVIQPYYTEENDTLEKIDRLIAEKEIQLIYPTRTRKLTVGTMNLIVYPPLEKNYNKTNNYSLAVLINHGEVNMLFAGDAEEKRSEELLKIHWPELSLFKVPHHGRANPLSQKLFETLKPIYAVVTAAQADEVIVEECMKYHTDLYFSSPDTLEFQSDGRTLRLMSEEKTSLAIEKGNHVSETEEK